MSNDNNTIVGDALRAAATGFITTAIIFGVPYIWSVYQAKKKAKRAETAAAPATPVEPELAPDPVIVAEQPTA